MQLTYKDKIEIMAKSIIDAHKGQSLFNPVEVGKIINKDVKFVNYLYSEQGLLAKKQGERKYYDAVTIAEYMYQNQISPIQPVTSKKRK